MKICLCPGNKKRQEDSRAERKRAASNDRDNDALIRWKMHSAHLRPPYLTLPISACATLARSTVPATPPFGRQSSP